MTEDRRFSRVVVVLDHASGAPRRDGDDVVGFDLFPTVREIMDEAATSGMETVVALPTEARGADQLAASIGVGRITAVSAEIGVPSEDVSAFVCADRSLRGRARAAGFVPAAHAAMLPLLARSEVLVAARFSGPREVVDRFARAHGVVPMHFQPTDSAGSWALIGIATPHILADAVIKRLGAVPLDCDPAVDDLVWVRVDGGFDDGGEGTRAGLGERRILFAEPGQVLLALGPEEDSEAIGLHGSHGHTEFLLPDPGLLEPARAATHLDLPDAALAAPSPILEEVVVDVADRRLIETTRLRCAVATRGYAKRLDRYTGMAPLDAAGPIASRHIAHPDNSRAEAQLLVDLEAMGYCPQRHEFLHNGVTLSNIVADLPGNGRFRVKPELVDRIRQILSGTDDFRSAAIAALQELGASSDDPAGDIAGGEAALDDLPEPLLRRELERIAALEPWNPWWHPTCPIGGVGAGLVVVGAHLDSTAGFDPGYAPASHPAPGRDDNGSGLAGVLTLAQHFRRYAGRLTHTVRFCFFNAEEAGLLGSKAYAAQLKAQRAPVRAVFCLDMMGYNSDSTKIFELHAGYVDPAVRDLSVPLATAVADAAVEAGSLLPAQVYTGTGYTGAPDRTVYDGAINRSDHAAFQQQGWGAILASEDFFANLATEPVPDGNPNYHRSADQTVDTGYARAITCAVGRAAVLAAL